MRLINNSSSPRYSELARATLKPGCMSRELDSFEKAFGQVSTGIRGFGVLLSDKDVEILYGLCVRHLLPVFRDMDPEADAAVSKFKATMEDPDGTRKFRDAYRERAAAIQKARANAIAAHREHEARIRSESNIIGADGNPIPKIETKEAAGGDVKPVMHPEMSTDLKSVIENNLAVMTTSSGKPISNNRDVVAKPGGSPVSHDPKYYQSHTPETPGKPEYFK